VTRRRMGQLAAAILASVAFGWSFWAAHTSAIPELRVYDGYLMMVGATITVALVGLLVWHWPRERSLIAIAAASVIGSLLPLGISAAVHNIPLMARLRGSWMLGGADVVGPPLVIGFVCLWFAMREYRESDLG
jgi:hypothetical protein